MFAKRNKQTTLRRRTTLDCCCMSMSSGWNRIDCRAASTRLHRRQESTERRNTTRCRESVIASKLLSASKCKDRSSAVSSSRCVRCAALRPVVIRSMSTRPPHSIEPNESSSSSSSNTINNDSFRSRTADEPVLGSIAAATRSKTITHQKQTTLKTESRTTTNRSASQQRAIAQLRRRAPSTPLMRSCEYTTQQTRFTICSNAQTLDHKTARLPVRVAFEPTPLLDKERKHEHIILRSFARSFVTRQSNERFELARRCCHSALRARFTNKTTTNDHTTKREK